MIFRAIMSICGGFLVMLYGTGYIFRMFYGDQAVISETTAKLWLIGVWAVTAVLIYVVWSVLLRLPDASQMERLRRRGK